MQELKDIERYGEPIIRYRMNVIGTNHTFLYKYKGLYYQFTKLRGQLVLNWLSDKHIDSTLIAPSKGLKIKNLKEYYNSSLNEWFSHESKYSI
tara:strand:- start:13 stop:291 length:279 start_codon:yes stop_codon:yes gene_type:complete